MSSKKSAESAASTFPQPDQKCPKNYKPWIWSLVAASLVTVVWALYDSAQEEGYVHNFLRRNSNAGKTASRGTLPVAGGTSVVPAAPAPGAVGAVQTSYHSIIDAVRPAVVSINAAMKNVPTGANQGMIDQFPADVAFNKIGSGINTAIFAPTGVSNGLGFAIPINRAAELVGGVIDFNNLTPGAATGQLVAWTSQGRQVGNAFRLPNGQTVAAPHAQLGACIDCHPQLFEPQAETGVGQQVALTGQGRLVGNSYLLPNGQTVTPPHTLRGTCTNCHQLTFLQKRAQAGTPAAFFAPNGQQPGLGAGRGGGFYGRGPLPGTPYNGAGQQTR